MPNRKPQTRRHWHHLAFLVAAVLLPLGALLGESFDAPNLCAWLTPFVVFVVVPLLDAAIGRDDSNPAPGEHASGALRAYYRILPLSCVVIVPFLIALVCGLLATDTGLDWAGRAGWMVSLGIATGVLAINAAHELIHKDTRHERLAGGFLLALVCYGTFKIEHVRGHHVRVATPADASSARLGQSLYHFVPRAVARNVSAAWRLERERLRRAGRRAFDPRNEVIGWSALSAAIACGIYAFSGPIGLAAWAAQSVIAVALLETVNYLEHYGLERARSPDGSYERTTLVHSWNSSHLLTNLLLFQLQRHSDHHAHPRRRYQELRHYDESPQLPAGYSTMVLLALVPPLWRRVMDPRVAALR
jgi:alkane 1-monooxygenase